MLRRWWQASGDWLNEPVIETYDVRRLDVVCVLIGVCIFVGTVFTHGFLAAVMGILFYIMVWMIIVWMI